MTDNSTYLVNEIYPCLQGEGANLGRPSVLVRLQICNLRCAWCDTPYTHTMRSDPVDKSNTTGEQNFKRLSLNDLVSQIKSYSNIRHVILSGGEPTLQNLAPLAEILHDTHTIEVESNGTQIPHKNHKSFKPEHYALMDWNISPKGKNAGQELKLEAIKHWTRLATGHVNVTFKFVVRRSHATEDIAEIDSLIESAQVPDRNIVLMAEGTQPADHLQNTWLEDICLQRGWRMTTRLHVLTHGNLRGF